MNETLQIIIAALVIACPIFAWIVKVEKKLTKLCTKITTVEKAIEKRGTKHGT